MPALHCPDRPTTNPLIAKLASGGALDQADRVRLQQVTIKRLPVKAHTDIIRQGEQPADVHLVEQGFACRYKLMPGGRRAIMAILIPGDFCDLDVAILAQMDHSIGALTPCTVVEIARATVNELTDQHPDIGRALRWCTLVDEATLREWLANMGQRAADRQLAHFLCEMRLRLEMVGMADRRGLHLPLTQEELADTLGISTVHVNRVLQQLREAGLLQVHGRNYAIPDMARLEAFAEFDPSYLHLVRGARNGLAAPQ